MDTVDLDSYHQFEVEYDYLLIALGGETNYHKNEKLKQVSFSLKTLFDANTLRSHIISTLEQADILNDNDPGEYERKKHLLTYVVVGGGFSGVETVGEINKFVREIVKQYYHNIDTSEIKVVLVSSGNRILPEMEEKLGIFALEELRKAGIHVILSNRVKDIKRPHTDYEKFDKYYDNKNKSPLGSLFAEHYKKFQYHDKTSLVALLNNNHEVSTYTIVWLAGLKPENVLNQVPLDRDKKGRLITNEYLQVKDLKNVFAVGDCSSVIDPQIGEPCPPTAQHAIRQGEIAGNNIALAVKTNSGVSYDDENVYCQPPPFNKFNYKTRGTMATIGKRKGVAVIFGIKVVGILAWMIWRAFYLNKIPSRANRFRVVVDWTVDLIFNRDIVRLKTPIELINPIHMDKEQ